MSSASPSTLGERPASHAIAAGVGRSVGRAGVLGEGVRAVVTGVLAAKLPLASGVLSLGFLAVEEAGDVEKKLRMSVV